MIYRERGFDRKVAGSTCETRPAAAEERTRRAGTLNSFLPDKGLVLFCIRRYVQTRLPGETHGFDREVHVNTFETRPKRERAEQARRAAFSWPNEWF